MNTDIKQGKNLTDAELEVINSGRKQAFGSDDVIRAAPNSHNGEALFFLLKDEGGEIQAFGKLHLMKVVFQTVTYPVYCISTLVSLSRGKGYGCRVLRGIERFLSNQKMTAFLFCESSLLPFYKKCGMEILERENNQFYFIQKNGKFITDPNIVPGEVIVVRGKDGLVERVLTGTDKRVGVID